DISTPSLHDALPISSGSRNFARRRLARADRTRICRCTQILKEKLMKLLFFDDFKLGVLKGGTVVDASQVVRDLPHTGPHDLIARSEEHTSELQSLAY